MSVRTWKEIKWKAKECKNNVEKNYNLGIYEQWGYYFAKAIITPYTNIKRNKSLGKAPKPHGDYVSRQINKEDYVQLAKNLVNFCENPKKNRMPNYLTWNGKKIRTRLYVYLFAKALVYFNKHKEFPDELNVNYKAFYPPKETRNVVFDYFVQKTGRKPSTVDEVLEYMQGKGYGSYYDDKLSNKQVIDGLIDTSDDLDANCTDALQMLINMAKAMGYETKCIHVECRTSNIGHVFGKFKHKTHTENTWITRDPACVLNGGGIRSIWCEDGWLLAEDPSWFNENLNR